MKTDLSQYTTGDYHPGASFLKQLLWYFINAGVLNAYWLPFSSVRVALLRLFGAKIGKGVCIKPAVNIKYPWRLSIGDYSWIGEGVWIDNLKEVSIGSHVCISQGSLLLCGNHDYKDPHFGLTAQAIRIADGAWIASKATVCPGVNVGEGGVLSVGSVASKDIPPYQVFAGVPATFQRVREIQGTSK